ncbi:Outer membrane receptor for ferrienterochelin and colicins [Pseudomonas cuatrocienegasensis]|uniref:Outer membrane receptor for ferrienterochelin and colicins n=1 Tax=Pseudomonas cuatrocienegasensis TaxID=543360 RepID=A0ABY1B6L9_9PSED|nr:MULTISPECIES: TonB-dependent receptor [Pseudomonas]SEQ09362.1 Outer membrane receptor for ferrienterochelin and colicins [Pseudomonas cuatrocienegasensis]
MATTAPTATLLKRYPWLSKASLAALLLTQHLPAQADALQEQLTQRQAFEVPAQPLAGALLEFAQQAGLQVSVDSGLVGERNSPGISGEWSTQEALQRLLSGSGLRWRVNTANSLTLEVDPDYRAQDPAALQTPDIVVLGKADHNFQGEAVINRRAIENFAGGNGDLTTMLKMHPSVRFDTTQQSSNTPGEINPADISINGAKFYQNNFMVDGISINNDLDPGASSGSRSDVNGQYLLPSNAFGIALDADLLEEVRVYDSNVSAKYGRFNGGVIDAITRRPTKEFHGKVSAQMTKSDWTRYHINNDQMSDEEFAKSSTYSNQPEFEKLSTRVVLEGHLTDNFGLIGNFVRKTSEIPLYSYDGGFESAGDKTKHNQERLIENKMVKAFWTPSDRLDMILTLVDAPAENTYFKSNQRDSGFRIDQGGQTAALKTIWTGDTLTYTQQFAYKMVQSSRDADSSTFKQWRWSQEKNWGNPYRDGVLYAGSTSIEGGMGDIEQEQSGLEYNLDIQAIPFDLAGSAHTLSFGMEVRRQKASYEVSEDTLSASVLRRSNATGSSTCVTASGQLDSDYCSISVDAIGTPERQYFGLLNSVRAGKVEAEQIDYALYLQDDIQIGNLKLRPGVRFDADDYMDKKTIAPRFAASYDFFGDETSVLTAGLNRYYGRNLFKYRLADGRESLRWRATRLNSSTDTIRDFGPWTNFGVDENSFRQLDIPYDDEWMVGFSQRLVSLQFELKYVHRDGKDQVVRSRANYLGLEQGNGVDAIDNYYTYTNAGQSRSETVTLTVTPLENLKFAGTMTSFMLGLDWNRTQSPQSNYDDLLNEDRLADEDVYFDGRLIPYSELPADNFNRPWTARLNTVTSIPALNLTWTNFLRYRGAYEQIFRATPENITINGGTYENYEVGEVSAAPTWDTRVKWTLPLGGSQSTYVAVDVTNVTDKVNNIVSNTAGVISYETGRQYWLEVGYQF